MAFRIRTLNACNKIAAGMSPSRYMSLDGAKLVEIIKKLLPESNAQPEAVCRQLRAIGKANRWDMPRMTADQEGGYLRWLVVEVAKS